MLVAYNPTEKPVSERLRVNVYFYTGLREVAIVTGSKGDSIQVSIERDDTVELKVDVPPNGMSWYLLK
jgi:hypothetical protein